MSPLLAQSRHRWLHCECPLLGVKRTCRFALHMSAFDPKRTLFRSAMVCIPVRCAPEAVMRRREFISLIGGVAATRPLLVHAQQPALPNVGLLRSTEAADYIAAFRRGLSDSGYADGTNVTLDIRVAEGKQVRFSDLAADLVRKRVAVIVANTNATPYAISATKSIPIVFVTGRDPTAAGFVPNLNHPGGNVTGVSFFNEALTSKR